MKGRIEEKRNQKKGERRKRRKPEKLREPSIGATSSGMNLAPGT